MKEPVLSFDEIQQEHLDMLLRLAFQQEQLIEAQEIVKQCEHETAAEDETLKRATLCSAYKKLDQQAADEKRLKWKQQLHRFLPRLIEVAACIVLVLGIAVPIAIANVESIRAKVMQLLIEIDDQAGEANIHFDEDPQAGFDVPVEWTGTYYPAYIPSGMGIVQCEAEGSPLVEYASAQGQQLLFSEYDQSTSMTAGTEGATISYLPVSGGVAFVAEGMDEGVSYVRVLWANDSNWFSLDAYNLSRDETLKVASSVKKIIR